MKVGFCVQNSWIKCSVFVKYSIVLLFNCIIHSLFIHYSFIRISIIQLFSFGSPFSPFFTFNAGREGGNLIHLVIYVAYYSSLPSLSPAALEAAQTLNSRCRGIAYKQTKFLCAVHLGSYENKHISSFVAICCAHPSSIFHSQYPVRSFSCSFHMRYSACGA